MGNYEKLFFKLSSIIILLSSFLANGQHLIDSLNNKTYAQLFQDLNNKKSFSEKDFYAKFIIKKAKKENNNKYLIYGYHTQAILYNDENSIKYSDSIISLSTKNSDRTYPLEAYQLKGDHYFNQRDYKKALNNYLKVSEYANIYKNKKSIIKSNDNIGSIKRKIGEKNSALKLYLKNLDYFNEKPRELDTIGYLNCLTSIANIYNDMELGDSSSYYNNLGYKVSKKLNNRWFSNHFSLNEGVSLFYKKEYVTAIDSLEKHIPYFEKTTHKINLSLAYYYCGKSYQELDKIGNAVKYFKKVDTVFQVVNSIYPNARGAYEELITYYKQKNDLKNQLLYINQLIKVDSIFYSNALFLNRKIFKEYDIPKLNAEKEKILSQLEKDTTRFRNKLAIMSSLLAISLLFLIYQYNKRKIYKKRFEKILSETNESFSLPIKKDNEIDIPQDIIDHILSQLNIFETNLGYVSNKTSLNSLAKKLNTNTHYLSKIINKYKNKTFSNYLNTLRIEYIIKLLKSDAIYRKYTIKAIAEEAGFGNSESFSKAFYKLKGIKPSYFIKELKKVTK
jgi:AraC-like DNA-binding protein